MLGILIDNIIFVWYQNASLNLNSYENYFLPVLQKVTQFYQFRDRPFYLKGGWRPCFFFVKMMFMSLLIRGFWTGLYQYLRIVLYSNACVISTSLYNSEISVSSTQKKKKKNQKRLDVSWYLISFRLFEVRVIIFSPHGSDGYSSFCHQTNVCTQHFSSEIKMTIWTKDDIYHLCDFYCHNLTCRLTVMSSVTFYMCVKIVILLSFYTHKICIYSI